MNARMVSEFSVLQAFSTWRRLGLLRLLLSDRAMEDLEISVKFIERHGSRQVAIGQSCYVQLANDDRP